MWGAKFCIAFGYCMSLTFPLSHPSLRKLSVGSTIFQTFKDSRETEGSYPSPATASLKGQALVKWKRRGNKLCKVKALKQMKPVNKISPYFASVQEGSSVSCFPS